MKNSRKGIVLSGGLGTRLYPNTVAISKQLLPIYSKPTIYYPITTLMLSGINEICIISSQEHLPMFRALLGSGAQWGCEFSYICQGTPGGIAEALLLAEDFLAGSQSALVLGDNIFLGSGLGTFLTKFCEANVTSIFTHPVSDPERYGIAEMDANRKVISIEEKPLKPKSNQAIVGLYFFDNKASEMTKHLQRSKRNELEITALNQLYLDMGMLNCVELPRGTSWFDTGTPSSFADVTNYIRTLEDRDGILVCAPEEVSFLKNFVTLEHFAENVEAMPNSYYRDSLISRVKFYKNEN